MLTQEKNRLGFALKPVQKGIRKHIEWLERQLTDVDADLDERIRQSPALAAKSDLRQSVPGVGPNLSRTLIAELPELGTLCHKHMPALVGVVPRARVSCQFPGQTGDLGRPGSGTFGALPERAERGAADSRDPPVPRPPAQPEKVAQGRSRRLQEEAAPHAQCHGP
jgi:hypothetical protein